MPFCRSSEAVRFPPVLGRIYFPTIATLTKGDPFECRCFPEKRWRNPRGEDLKSRAQNLFLHLPAELKSGDRQRDFSRYQELVQKLEIDDLRKHVQEMEAIKNKKRVVCSCWHFGGGESDAMWKLYGGQFAVGLVSTVGRLARSLKGSYSCFVCAPNPQEYAIAPVNYVNPDRLGRLDAFYVKNPWLLKRIAFQHEQEVRIFHTLANMVPGNGGIDIAVNPAMLPERNCAESV